MCTDFRVAGDPSAHSALVLAALATLAKQLGILVKPIVEITACVFRFKLMTLIPYQLFI